MADARPVHGARLEPLEPRLLLNAAPEEQAIELFQVSPALFVENRDQWAESAVRYLHSGSGASVAMTDAGPVFQVFRRDPKDGAAGEPEDGLGPEGLPDDLADPLGHGRFDPDAYETSVLQFSTTFLGANPVTPVGMDRSAAYFNYFVGDASAWRSDVPAYEEVVYAGLYDGIDLYTWGQRDSLKYEFHVSRGADWSRIRIRYEGIAGLALREDGSLVVDLGEGWGRIVDAAPYIYQDLKGGRLEVAGRFRLLADNTHAFDLTGPFDPRAPLVIDPDLAWATYLGGSDYDYGYGIAVDSSGNAYLAGYTESSGWATPGAYDTTHNGNEDIFVAKITSPDPVRLAWLASVDHQWQVAANWSPAEAPDPDTATVIGTVLCTAPVVYDQQCVYGVEFQGSSRRISAAGGTLWLGGGGLDAFGTGTHLVDVPLRTTAGGVWSVAAGNAVYLRAGLAVGGHVVRKEGSGSLSVTGTQDHAAGASVVVAEGGLTLLSNAGTRQVANLTLTALGGATISLILPQHLAALRLEDSASVLLGTGPPQPLLTRNLAFAADAAGRPTAKMDIKNYPLIVDYAPGSPSPAAQANAWVAAGYNAAAGGYWNGPGITSSLAAGDANGRTAVGVLDNANPWLGGRTTFGGEPVDATAVLVKYTYWGDANLDGRVTAGVTASPSTPSGTCWPTWTSCRRPQTPREALCRRRSVRPRRRWEAWRTGAPAQRIA